MTFETPPLRFTPTRHGTLCLVAAGLLACAARTAGAEDAAPADSLHAAADSVRVPAGLVRAPADSVSAPADPVRAGAAPAGTRAEAAAPHPHAQALAAGVTDLGFENVSIDSASAPSRVAFENRRYRHEAESFGLLERACGGPMVAFDRRLGLLAAAITRVGPPDRPRFEVRYPSDSDFPAAPSSRPLSPTSRSVDLVVGPLFAYELGHITEPIQFRFQIEPRIRYNAWPGMQATASVVIPVYNDFVPDDLHPDVERLRPGLLTVDQYAWLSRVALTSASAGVFADNRYGLSLGAARPLAQGMFLLDAQADVTGFIAFEEGGTTYSSMSQWSTYGGITWRPPIWDCAIRARAAQFLYGDRGAEVEFTRSMGDVDIALYGQRTKGFTIQGVRVTVPVPPMVRSTRPGVRMQPIERFPVSYRTEVQPVGLHVRGVASREDFLRQLSAPALNANLDRYRQGLGNPRAAASADPIDWVSFTGSTGFINTPWAGVMRDRGIELGYSHIPRQWAYDSRSFHANEPYSMTVGLLPRVEVALRFTRIPGRRGFVDDPDNRITTDTDHMVSGRLELLTARPGRPGLAVGADDVEGTRRYHSSYVVTGVPLSIFRVQNRLSLGYAPRVFTATRHVLDGGFGAFEVSPWRAVAARVEYDTEKWNAGIGVGLGFGLKLRVAALNLESWSGGVGWFHEL